MLPSLVRPSRCCQSISSQFHPISGLLWPLFYYCLRAVEWTLFEDFTGKERRELDEEEKEEEVICSSVHPPYETILIQVLCACHCYTFYLQLSYSLHFDFVFDFSKPLSHHVSFDVLYEDVADSILKKLNI